MKLRKFEYLICFITKHSDTATPKKYSVTDLYNVLKTKYSKHHNLCNVVPGMRASCYLLTHSRYLHFKELRIKIFITLFTCLR